MKIRNWWKLPCCLLLTASVLGGSSSQIQKINNDNRGESGVVCAAIACMNGKTAQPTLEAIDVSENSLCGEALTREDLEGLTLTPGGMTFGVKFATEGISIVGFSEVEGENGKRVNPAEAAGLRLKDVILSVNGKSLSSAAELTRAIEECGRRAGANRFLQAWGQSL